MAAMFWWCQSIACIQYYVAITEWVEETGSSANKTPFVSSVWHIDGLVQGRRNSIANALELRLSYINPSVWFTFVTPLLQSYIWPQ